VLECIRKLMGAIFRVFGYDAYWIKGDMMIWLTDWRILHAKANGCFIAAWGISQRASCYIDRLMSVFKA